MGALNSAVPVKPGSADGFLRPTADRALLIAAFRKASRAWNADGGPIEKTVKAGEDLFFARTFSSKTSSASRSSEPRRQGPARGTAP
jgi:hypothetical protein